MSLIPNYRNMDDILVGLKFKKSLNKTMYF